MSQAKVDKYKQEKANRKKIMAKEKAKSVVAKVCGTIIASALALWIGVSAVVFVIENRPISKFFVKSDAIENFLDKLYEEETEKGTETTEKEDPKDSTEKEDSTQKAESTEKTESTEKK